MNKKKAWLLAMRPKTLPAAISPVLVGVSLAVSDGKFKPLTALLTLLCSVILQIGANVSNDYFDHVRGIDGTNRLGPIRVTSSGFLSPNEVRAGLIVIFILSIFVGLYLVIVGGFPIMITGILAIASALAYSGGPFPLASHALGDLFVLLFFGIVAVNGSYYLQTGTFSITSILLSIPVGLIITNIMVINNLRDIRTDREVDKKTLAVLIGEANTHLEYIFIVILSLLIPMVIVYSGLLKPIVAVIPLITLPFWIILVKESFANRGQTLNVTLARTALLALLYCILLSIGLLLQ